MGLDKIERKIREAGEKEISRIREESELEVQRIKSETDNESSKAYTGVKQASRRERDLLYRRIMADARMKERKIIEERKSEVLDAAFEDAKAGILDLSEKEQARILRKLADAGKKEINDSVVYVDRKYAKLIDGAKTKDLGDFGVVVESKDGLIRIDNTLNSIMLRLKQRIKPNVAKVLFQP